MRDAGNDLVSHQPLQGKMNNNSGKFEILFCSTLQNSELTVNVHV